MPENPNAEIKFGQLNYLKMKKLESLSSSKFDTFQAERIAELSKIFGGETINSPADQSGCTDTYSWTKRDVVDSKGLVVGSVNDKDNQVWDCPGNDSISPS